MLASADGECSRSSIVDRCSNQQPARRVPPGCRSAQAGSFLARKQPVPPAPQSGVGLASARARRARHLVRQLPAWADREPRRICLGRLGTAGNRCGHGGRGCRGRDGMPPKARARARGGHDQKDPGHTGGCGVDPGRIAAHGRRQHARANDIGQISDHARSAGAAGNQCLARLVLTSVRGVALRHAGIAHFIDLVRQKREKTDTGCTQSMKSRTWTRRHWLGLAVRRRMRVPTRERDEHKQDEGGHAGWPRVNKAPPSHTWRGPQPILYSLHGPTQHRHAGVTRNHPFLA